MTKAGITAMPSDIFRIHYLHNIDIYEINSRITIAVNNFKLYSTYKLYCIVATI